MKNTGRNGVPPRRLLRRCLFTSASLILFFVLLLPGIKFFVNHVVFPHLINDARLPLQSARLARLTAHKLIVTHLVLDAGNGITARADQVEAVYSPRTLLHVTVPRVHTRVTLDPYEMVSAEINIYDICFRDGIRADLTAQCDRMSYGAWSAGPFCATSHLFGTAAELAADIPLQDGLLNARVDLQADWTTNPVWNCVVDLPLADMNGLSLSGLLRAECSGTPTNTAAAVSLAVDRLEIPEHGLVLSNLQTSCIIKLPGELRSQPAQALTADSLSVGKMQMENIRMHYQVEPAAVFFIEDLEFDWCGGRVSLYSARFTPESPDVALRLFCDRLDMERVFKEFGLTGFSADGELSGRLPVEWTKNGLSIDRGFLFTTPGRGGTLSFGSAKAAAGLLPPGSLEGGQLGMVASALANFNYDWITLTLNSEGENLRLDITLAGKPVDMLPYEYDSRSESYVKIEPRPGRGTRQPMQFDLHFTIPLNQLLCYGSGISRRWELFKTQP